MNKENELVNTIKASKLNIMKNSQRYLLLQVVLQEIVMGRRGVGRKIISWLKNLRIWFSSRTNQLFRAVVNKVIIVKIIADI